MKTVIIRYNAGNVKSVEYALSRLGVTAVVSDSPEEIMSAGKVILPGVGEAGTAMKYLSERKLDVVIKSLKQPLLGICLGMQLMCEYSEEGQTECMGIFEQPVRKFPAGNKIPQIGWNTVKFSDNVLFRGLPESEHMYFVHGYYAGVSENTIAKTNYGSDYSSALCKNNFYGVQFHPEKSGEKGQKIVENFLKL